MRQSLYLSEHANAVSIPLQLNTSNKGKLAEFREFFHEYAPPSLKSKTLESTSVDLQEVDTDPITVVVHKASTVGENILVEDTSLEVEGADVGVNVRWLMDRLPEFIGKKATARVLIAFAHEKQVYVYEGKVHGKIVEAHGTNGFGFDPIFMPDGSDKTFAEAKPKEQNPRALAVKNLFRGQPIAIKPIMLEWHGKWQDE